MPVSPHDKCFGCCCSLHTGVLIGTALYMLYLLVTGVVLPLAWPKEPIDWAKAFCTGTTAEYRKGDSVNSYDLCHGYDICDGTNWDNVSSEAMASWTFSTIVDVLAVLLLAGNMFLVFTKSVAIGKMWKVLAVMPLVRIIGPILQATVSAPAQTLQDTAINFYERAAMDKKCLDFDANGMVELGTANLEYKSGFDFEATEAKCRTDQKWIGAPDPTDDLVVGWAGSPCESGRRAIISGVLSFVVWFVFYLLLYGYFVFKVWSFKEELVKQPMNEREMATTPTVATATAIAIVTATATPAVAVATAVATAKPSSV